jgi:hypothetical protein
MAKSLDPKLAIAEMLKAGFKTLEPYPGAGKSWKSKCLVCKKIVKPRLASIKRGGGCAYCTGTKVDPADAKSLMLDKNLKPLEPYIAAHHRWKCQCLQCGKIIYLQYHHVKQGVSGCAYCSGNRVDAEDAIKHLLLLGFSVIDKYEGAHKKLQLKCIKCGDISTNTYAHLKNKSQSCYYCKKNRPRLNLVNVERQLSKDFELLEPIKSGSTKTKAICRGCGREVLISYENKKKLIKCLFCSGVRVDASDAVRFMNSAGFKPLEDFPGSTKKWKARHIKCGNSVYVLYKSIKRRGGGCKFCSKVFVDPTEAVKIMKEHGFKPLVPYPGAGKRWLSSCKKCKRKSLPTYASTTYGHGCRFCAIQGMNYNEPAFIYLILHSKYDALKIGIGSQELRLKQHKKHGWQVVKVWNYKTGYKASEIEEKVLDYLRNELNLKYALSKELMPQKGHTETFSLDDVSIPIVKRLIESFTAKYVNNS